MVSRARTMMYVLKLLTLLTVAIGLSNFLYNLNSPVPLPLNRRINVHRRHLNSVDKQRKSTRTTALPSSLKVPAGKFTRVTFVFANGNVKNVEKNRKYEEKVVYCPDTHPHLGKTFWKSAAKPDNMEQLFSMLDKGGSYEPIDCVPTEIVAVIIPFRGQDGPQILFLFSLHLFLLTQLVKYQIFVVKEYNETTPFKPGLLSNIGFIESQKIRQKISFTCVVFHDPYLAPMNSKNLYQCTKQPKQLVASIDNVPFNQPLGGAIAIRPEDFNAVNGFSNVYNDSEAIYLDLYDRLMAANYTIDSPTPLFATYESVSRPLKQVNTSNMSTTKAPPATANPVISSTSVMFYDEEGLTSLSTKSYSLKISKAKLTYTEILVHTGPGLILDPTKSSSVNTVTENDAISPVLTTTDIIM